MLKLEKQYGLYTIKEQLTVGDDRACCCAADPFLGHDVLLQLIKLPEQWDSEQLESFEKRLESLATLNHSALAPIYDIGHEKNLCYYTTAFYTAGSSIEGLTEPLSEQEGLRALKHLTEGLAYAENKGFEHGLIVEDEVFLAEKNLPVMANFGVTELLDSLYGSKETASTPSQIPSLAQKQSLYSLGSLFLALVLTKEQRSASMVDQVVKLKGSREKRLITELLGLSQEALTSYDELLRQLTEMITPTEQELLAMENQTPAESSVSKPPEEKTVPQEPVKSSVPQQATSSQAEINKLVAEKIRLQSELKEITDFKAEMKRKTVLLEQEVNESKKAEKQAREDVKVAWEMLDKQQEKPSRPLLWLLAGCLVGAILASGFSYLLPAKGTQIGSGVSQRISIQRVPIAVESATPPQQTVQKPVESAAAASTEVSQQQQEEEQVYQEMTAEGEQPVVSVADESASAKEESQKVEGAVVEPVVEKVPQKKGEMLVFSEDQAEKISGEEKSKILDAIQGWGRAWENQDFQSYLAHYSAEYQPDAGQSREEWMTSRQNRLAKPKWVKIKLADLQLRALSTDLVRVRLTQIYRSDSYGDQTLKALDFVREDGQWMIWMERPVQEDEELAGS